MDNHCRNWNNIVGVNAWHLRKGDVQQKEKKQKQKQKLGVHFSERGEKD